MMDPKIAITAWAVVRGDNPGFFFCNISKSTKLRFEHHIAWNRKSFLEFFHARLRIIGIPDLDLLSFTGHSMKRRGVQVLRFLGVKDRTIMDWE